MLTGRVPATVTLKSMLPPCCTDRGVARGCAKLAATARSRTLSVTASLQMALAKPGWVACRASRVPLADSGTLPSVRVAPSAPLTVAPASAPLPAPLFSGVPLQARTPRKPMLQLTLLYQRSVGVGVPVTPAAKVVPSPSRMSRAAGWAVMVAACVKAETVSVEAWLNKQRSNPAAPRLLQTCTTYRRPFHPSAAAGLV